MAEDFGENLEEVNSGPSFIHPSDSRQRRFKDRRQSKRLTYTMKIDDKGNVCYQTSDIEMPPEKQKELWKISKRAHYITVIGQVAQAFGAVVAVAATCIAVYKGSKAAVTQGVDPRFDNPPAPPK